MVYGQGQKILELRHWCECIPSMLWACPKHWEKVQKHDDPPFWDLPSPQGLKSEFGESGGQWFTEWVDHPNPKASSGAARLPG